MPFKSQAQAKYLFAKKPKIAKKWASEGYGWSGLPTKKRKEEKKRKEKAFKLLARHGGH